MLYDWMGHGYNQTKRLNKPTPALVPCTHCGKHDDQAHIMLECTHPALSAIRQTARLQQSSVATTLRTKHQSNLMRHLIDQFEHASWVCPSQHTRRIWLGTWTPETLQALLPVTCSIIEPMNTKDRHTYRGIVCQLTAPLIDAYTAMTQLQLSSQQLESTIMAPKLLLKTRRHMQLLFHTTCNDTVLPHLRNSPLNPACNTFTYSNAAFSLPDAAIGILHNHSNL